MSDGRIRVLTLISGLAIGGASGGADRFGLEMARGLDRDRFEPIICAFWQRDHPAEPHWLDLLRGEGLRVFFAAHRGARFSFGQYAAGMRRILRETERHVDIIHSHFQMGSLAASLLRGPLHARGLVRTAHGMALHEWHNDLINRLCRFVFTESLFPFAFDQEVGVSHAATESLNARWGARVAGRSGIMIPNAIPAPVSTRVDRVAKRRALGFGPENVLLGSVGRLTTQKGYTYLMRAAPRILAHCPEAHILVAGDGELRGALEQEARSLGVGDKVHFLGVRTDVGEIYQAMDLFVLPSLWEGLPTVVLEAMAYGVPVVATDIAGTRDLLADQHNGWLARPADADDLARAVVEALQCRSTWPLVVERAAGETVPMYRIERIVQRYEALFESLCSRQAPQGRAPRPR